MWSPAPKGGGGVERRGSTWLQILCFNTFYFHSGVRLRSLAVTAARKNQTFAKVSFRSAACVHPVIVVDRYSYRTSPFALCRIASLETPWNKKKMYYFFSKRRPQKQSKIKIKIGGEESVEVAWRRYGVNNASGRWLVGSMTTLRVIDQR